MPLRAVWLVADRGKGALQFLGRVLEEDAVRVVLRGRVSYKTCCSSTRHLTHLFAGIFGGFPGTGLPVVADGVDVVVAVPLHTVDLLAWTKLAGPHVVERGTN